MPHRKPQVAVGDAYEELTHDEIAEIKEIFRALDKEQNNSISVAELRWSLRFLGQNPTHEEVRFGLTSLKLC